MKRLLIALSILTTVTPVHADTQISSCTDITFAGTAVVTTDLDCSADQLEITIEPSGKLELQGHTITNADVSCDHPGQLISANCTIEGPGTFHGELGSSGKIVVRNLDVVNGSIIGGRVKVDGVNITGPGNYCAIYVEPNYQGSLKIIDTTVTGAHCGVESEGNTTIRNSRFLSNTGYGVRVRYGGFNSSLRMADSEVSGNGGYGVSSSRISIKNSTIDDNGGVGVGLEHQDPDNFVTHLSIKGSRVRGNRVGISNSAQRTSPIFDCTITGNTEIGIDDYAKKLNIRRSTVTGNAYDPACGSTIYCADIISYAEPALDAQTTCDTSLKWDFGFTGENWGVCSLD